MKTDNLKELFEGLDFDIAEPTGNHEEKFREKIEKRSAKKVKKSGVLSLWLPAMAIAASFLLAFVIFQGMFGKPFPQKQELANVSPEMKQTQDFYTSAIKAELENLKSQKSPETEIVINDALKQMQVLESEYENLKKDLSKSGQDKRVIFAMITNFQKRIDLLKSVLEKVDTINTLNTTSHETNIL